MRQRLKKLKGLAVSCFVMEVLDLHFCIQTDPGDAAESTTIDLLVKHGAVAVSMIANIGRLTEIRFESS